MPRELRVLAACETSGRVREAFRKRGWESWSADLLPTEEVTWPGPTSECPGRSLHYQGDVRDLFDPHHPVNFERTQEWSRSAADEWTLWDLVIAFPPCTDLSLAGAVWWKVKRMQGPNGEPSVQDEAAGFFMQMVNAPAPHIAVENPRGDMTRRWRAPDQYVEPCWFGDPTAKKIGLWLKDLPPLAADNPVDPGPNRVATGGGSWKTDLKNGRKSVSTEDSEGRARRDIVRSRTSREVARAMAAQWGKYIEEKELK